MSTRRSLAVAAVFLAAAGFVGPAARAEVSVETDAFGRYVRTVIMSQATVRQYRIWKIVRRNTWAHDPLNPEGDRTGDQYPALAENPANRRHPWAVWSRFRGGEYDLVWSQWRPGGWTAIAPVLEESGQGDDLAPSLVFVPGGRPYVSWWRDEEGQGRVYLSFFLVTRWSDPIPVSDAGVDSRQPRVSVLDSGDIEVAYRVPGGTERRVVSLNGGTTITDDLNPVGQVSVTRIANDDH
jgi:hypothetical protein